MVRGQKKDSRIKTKGKQKLVLAKDNKQLALAVFVLVLFLANSVYMIVKHFQGKNVTQSTQQSTQELNQNRATLEGLTGIPQENSVNTNQNLAQDANNIYSQTLNAPQGVSQPSLKQSQTPADDIDIISKKVLKNKDEKMVSITITNSGRSNPFLPADENVLPASLSYLTAPPETLPTKTDATKIIDTTISGILYDKYSPSAIINIEGTDYLVKRGDIINRYKILSIDKTQVLVQLGQNIYKAGVGELLSQTDLNQNNIPNLNQRFGGNNNISINVKKKGY